MPQIDFNRIPFVQARYFTPTSGRTVNKIVIHSMEAPEKGDTAEAVARYFSRITRPASAHYCIDNNSIIQCVQTKDVAYAAPGANHDGIQIELAGYARQTVAEWKDPYSLAVLKLTAQLCGRVLVPKYRIPALRLESDDLRRVPGARGFTTHASVSLAFKRSTHWDPGLGFPFATFLEFVNDAIRGSL